MSYDQLDEDLKKLINNYKIHHSNAFDGYEYGDDEKGEYHEKEAEKIHAEIVKKHGAKAGEHARAAGQAEIYGTERRLSNRPDTLSGGLRKNLSKDVTKAGKIPKSTQKAMKGVAASGDNVFKRKIGGPKGKLPEDIQIGSNKMDYEQLDEFKADGENSSVADPTGVSAKKRPADKTEPGEPMQRVTPLRSDEVGGNLLSVSTTKMPARKADKSMKEEVKELFDGELSEEFLDKASTMFEAAVIERVNLEVEALEEEYNEVLNEAVNEVRAELSAKMDDYLDYVVEQWMQDNIVAIESGIKTEITESFFAGLKTLFAEHYVDVPEDKVDLAESLAFKVAELEGELNNALTRNIELSNIIESNELEAAFDEVTDGLAVSQKERLAALSESFVFSSVDEYKSKLEVIKETFLAGSKKLSMVSTEKALNEEFDGENTSVEVNNDPQMEVYLSAVKKTIKR